MKRKTLLLFVLLFVIMLLIIAVTCGNRIWFLLTEKTVYAQGYDDGVFNTIRIGDSIDKVTTLLPETISKTTYNKLLIYSYSKPFGDASYKIRQIIFQDGSVVEIRRQDIID